jgi:hypothetical protein
MQVFQCFDDRRSPALSGVRVSFFQVRIGCLEIEVR